MTVPGLMTPGQCVTIGARMLPWLLPPLHLAQQKRIQSTATTASADQQLHHSGGRTVGPTRGRKTWSHRLRLAGWWQQYSPVGPRAHLVAPRGHEIAVFPYMPSTPKRAEAGAGRAPAEVITPVYRS